MLKKAISSFHFAAKFKPRLLALLVVGIFNLVIFNRYFPLSEGWWETYGYLYNLGLRPYTDFDLAFTPLFTIINAGLLHVFGNSFFCFRLFGVFVYLIATFCLQLFLEQFYSSKTSAIAIIVASFMLFNETQFIAKDYHTYQLLLVSLVLLLHTWLVGNAQLNKWQNLAATFVLGALVCLVIVLKQNVGVLLAVALIASFILKRTDAISKSIMFLLGATAGLYLMSPIVSMSDWHNILFKNDAKGDLITVFFRVLINPYNRLILVSALFIATVYFSFIFIVDPKQNNRKIWFDRILKVLEKPVVERSFLVVSAFFIVSLAVSLSFFHVFFHMLLVVCLAILIILTYQAYKYLLSNSTMDLSTKNVAIVLPLLALAYSNTNTSTFDYNGMQIPVAFGVGYILSRIEFIPSPRYWIMSCLFFLAITPRVVATKLLEPYSWWENVQGSVFSAKYETNYSDLRGIYVNHIYRDVFNEIKETVDKYSISSSDVYFYNLPLFYLLHKKVPPFRAVVHWFDVVSTTQMNSELSKLEKIPPRLIVAMEPSPLAFVIHRQLKHAEHLPQEDFQEHLDQWVSDGKYRLLKSIALPTKALKQMEGSDEKPILITQDVSLQSAKFFSKDVKYISGALDFVRHKVKVEGVSRDGVFYQIQEGFILRPGDVLRLSGRYKEVMSMSGKIGIGRDFPRDWNSVNIYLRNDVEVK
ncbi:MAG TPA: glycosyltransferase family 39 protein [Methylophilaceae bacterium]|jgi:hypothetical protein